MSPQLNAGNWINVSAFLDNLNKFSVILQERDLLIHELYTTVHDFDA
jgi:hypothetical protein